MVRSPQPRIGEIALTDGVITKVGVKVSSSAARKGAFQV
jgi:hypothetical protein